MKNKESCPYVCISFNVVLLLFFSFCADSLFMLAYNEKHHSYHEHTKVFKTVTGAGDMSLIIFPQCLTAVAPQVWQFKKIFISHTVDISRLQLFTKNYLSSNNQSNSILLYC